MKTRLPAISETGSHSTDSTCSGPYEPGYRLHLYLILTRFHL
jgi:hypothetical protein